MKARPNHIEFTAALCEEPYLGQYAQDVDSDLLLFELFRLRCHVSDKARVKWPKDALAKVTLTATPRHYTSEVDLDAGIFTEDAEKQIRRFIKGRFVYVRIARARE